MKFSHRAFTVAVAVVLFFLVLSIAASIAHAIVGVALIVLAWILTLVAFGFLIYTSLHIT